MVLDNGIPSTPEKQGTQANCSAPGRKRRRNVNRQQGSPIRMLNLERHGQNLESMTAQFRSMHVSSKDQS